MKKKLEGDLVSIAHRILKLKGKEDVVALHKEAKEVFEKLSVLLFFEEQFKDTVPDYADSSFFQTLENVYNHDKVEKNAEEEVIIRHHLVSEDPEQDELIEPLMETIKDMVAEMPEDDDDGSETIAETPKPTTPATPKQETLEDILADVLPQPTFVKSDEVESDASEVPAVETVTKEVTTKVEVEVKATKTETRAKSLNDRLNTGISIGLNDRIAFTKHLFDGNQEDYNRVISQLNTSETESAAKDFIYNMIKPEYNNWEGKEAYEDRFIEIIERKFA